MFKLNVFLFLAKLTHCCLNLFQNCHWLDEQPVLLTYFHSGKRPFIINISCLTTNFAYAFLFTYSALEKCPWGKYHNNSQLPSDSTKQTAKSRVACTSLLWIALAPASHWQPPEGLVCVPGSLQHCPPIPGLPPLSSGAALGAFSWPEARVAQAAGGPRKGSPLPSSNSLGAGTLPPSPLQNAHFHPRWFSVSTNSGSGSRQIAFPSGESVQGKASPAAGSAGVQRPCQQPCPSSRGQAVLSLQILLQTPPAEWC